MKMNKNMKYLLLVVSFFFVMSEAYAQGCVTILQPTSLQVQLSSTAILCNGGTSTITSTVSGGTTPYSYNWSNGATTADLVNILAGTYDVTVSDANACSKIESITVTQPTALAITCSKTDASFNGNNNGAASVSASGGTTPYTYAWGGGETTSSLSNLVAGTYSVTVTDANSCSKICSSIVGEPACALTATTSGTAVKCNGGSDGTASVSATGNIGAITYLWNTGATTSSISGLSANTYTVTITESATCKYVATYIVTEPIVLAITCSKTDATFNGNNNGTASVLASGGTTPYTYAWGGGETTSSLSNLVAGTYSVTVTDANSCSKICSSIVGEPACALTATTSGTAVKCNGGSDGTTSVSATGNIGAVTYLWNTGATTSSISGLSANTYSVTITESATCKYVATYIVSESTALAIVCAKTDATINGGNDGTASVVATGGTGAYTYIWDLGATTSGINNLVTDTYTVTVTDANGCSNVCSSVVSEPSCTLTATTSGTAVKCNGGSDGTASVSATGNIGAITYLWNTGATTSSISGLSANTYTVTITESATCKYVATYIVTEPTALTITCSKTDASFNGNNNGAASVSASGGTAPYTYLWGGGETTSSLSNLVAGTYSVTVTDANGCTKTCSSVVNEPSCALTAVSFGSAVTCNGGSDGIASVAVNGNIGAVTYLWDTGTTTVSINGLLANTYSVTITESATCKYVATYTVPEPTVLTIVCSKTDATYNGNNDGTASVSVSGGTSPYTYAWGGGETTSSLSNLVAGTYSVTVTDANGCSKECTSVVTEPACNLTISVTGTNVSCFGGLDGSASVAAINNLGSVTYSWGTLGNTTTIPGLPAGTYDVTVTESPTCTATGSYTVTEPDELVIVCSKTDATTYGGSDGTASVSATGGTSPYIYIWDNNATTSSISGIAAATYSVTVTDSKGCSKICTSVVGQPACNLVDGGLTVFIDEKGTASAADDEYVVMANPVGSGLGTTYNATGDINYTGAIYGIATEIGRVPISVSTASIFIEDVDSPGCSVGSAVYNFKANVCISNANVSVTCDNAGTPFDPSDDTFSIFLNPSGNGISTTYNVSGDITATALPYGSSQLIASGILISSGVKTIAITDGFSPSCQLNNIKIDPPAACSANGVAKLDLVKTVDKPEAKIGENVTYTIKVRNTGTAISNAIEVSDTLNSSLQFISATPSADYNNVTGIWTVGVLPVGGEATLTITAKILAVGVTQNYADITVGGNNDSDGPLNNHDVVCTTVPIELCTGTTFTLNIPSTYTDIQWYKDGALISGATSANLVVSSVGNYTFTSKESLTGCPVDGCCPIKVVPGTNCCPAKICLGVKLTRN
jgi:uncharacterized repeat protein (TIGR01451 family)